MRPPRHHLLPLLLLAAFVCPLAAAQDPSALPPTEKADTSEMRTPSGQVERPDKEATPSTVDRAGEAETSDEAAKAQSESSEQPKAVEQQQEPVRAEIRAPANDPSALQANKPSTSQKVADPQPSETTPSKADDGKTASAATAKPSLPADSVTHHVLELPGRTLQYEAVAGSIPLTNSEGQTQASIAYVSYTLAAGVGSRARPVAFVFNGGPGAASAWLHLGTLGPWRLPLEGDSARPSAPGVLMPNAETWLDFCDLVMIDPVGTGFSRFESGTPDEDKTDAETSAAKGAGKGRAKAAKRPDLKKHYWSISGDADSLANFIYQWLTKTGRHTSPKVLVGESYGGFRAPKIARELQSDYGVGVNLLVLVSPVLDYGFLRGQRHLPFHTVALLPSLSAAALEARGTTPSPTLMREAEEYARGEYLTDLLRGPRDAAAVGRIVKRVTALTGLPTATVQKYGGRLDSYGYRREANAAGRQVASAYDASIKGLDPEPDVPYGHAQDPFVAALRAPLTTAMLDLYATKLAWRPQSRYLLLNTDVSGNWQYGNSPAPPEVVSDLKSALSLDARLRVLVAHGYTDLVTPYFASALVLDQLPAYGDARRVFQVNYPGGHMFYSRDGSRAAFREDVLIMLAASLTGEAPTR